MLFRSVKKGCNTFAVDGRGNILINLGFANSLSDEQLVGVLAHEAMHIWLEHHARMRGQTPFDFVNISMDAFINNDLHADGFELPKQGVQASSGHLYVTALYVERVVPEINLAKPALINLALPLHGENWESLFEQLVKKLTIPAEARKLRTFHFCLQNCIEGVTA